MKSVSDEDQSWLKISHACIDGHNNDVYFNIATVGSCIYKCKHGAIGFTCRSIEYHIMAKVCILSEVYSNTAYDDFNVPCPHHDGWTYRQRYPLGHRLDLPNSCIKAKTIANFANVATKEDCWQYCLVKHKCKSLNYNKGSKACKLTGATYETGKLYAPCPVTGWEYVEKH
ncbi:unnamed protein product [Owenia fusiformis]|uniref:Apple domain-containing protein n=1 Tax=Owenia fusiformis TaxID=6347 RepID=A0A8S4NZ38_OWEFU|nr:unnamed protein product [Owenia fusiformis]